MKRYTYPTFISCKAPRKAIQLPDKSYKLPICLKKSFHHTYVDTHDRPPRRGTNPIFDEYEQLLDSSDQLRFLSPGIADDTESKIGESRKLGRGIARYILSEYYGYTWFGKIQNLITGPQRGWSIERTPKGGNTPDWLISDGGSQHCIGEAKGTHSTIDTSSAKVKDWREQCTNIIVKHNKRKRKLKSWLIATRFVTDQTNDLPEQLIEDPYTEGEELSSNDYQSMNGLIVGNHLSDSLFRISNFRLGLRVRQNNSTDGLKYRTMTWRPIIKELSHLTFIGRPKGFSSFYTSRWHWREFMHFRDDIDFWAAFLDFYTMFNDDLTFDGIAVNTIRNYFSNNFSEINIEENSLDNYPFISLLKDGNLIIPMSLMRPDGFVDL
jgi:hypothetical protein